MPSLGVLSLFLLHRGWWVIHLHPNPWEGKFSAPHRIRQICLYFILKPRLATWNSLQIAVFNKWIVCVWHSLKSIKHSWGRVSLYRHLTRCETLSPVKQHDTLDILDWEAAELALALLWKHLVLCRHLQMTRLWLREMNWPHLLCPRWERELERAL